MHIAVKQTHINTVFHTHNSFESNHQYPARQWRPCINGPDQIFSKPWHSLPLQKPSSKLQTGTGFPFSSLDSPAQWRRTAVLLYRQPSRLLGEQWCSIRLTAAPRTTWLALTNHGGSGKSRSQSYCCCCWYYCSLSTNSDHCGRRRGAALVPAGIYSAPRRGQQQQLIYKIITTAAGRVLYI